MSKKLFLAGVIVLLLCANGPVYAFQFSDDFSTPHDYVADEVAGTGWDGFVGLGAGETVDSLNANISRTGQLYIQSTGGFYHAPWDLLGPFLYKIADGDFIATVRVTDYQNILHNSCGLMARAFPDAAAGPGEDWVSVDYFPIYDCGNFAREADDNARTELCHNGLAWGLAAYLQLQRIGNTFHFRYSFDGSTFSELDCSPIVRSDLGLLPLQVGLWQCTYSANTGYTAFDDFSLICQPWPNARGPNPPDGATNVPVDTRLSWTPGDYVQDVNGHDVYIDTNFNYVNDANRANHSSVDYYNVSDPCCYPGPLEFGKTYYWRVDEINDANIWQGDIWSFTTAYGVPEPNLVGIWKFDEASGTIAVDSSGNNNHGTIYGGALLNGSGWLTLDGIDDYVSLPIGSVIASLTNCTFAVWVDFSNEGGAWQRIFDFGSNTTVNMFLTPRTGTTGPMRFAITIGGGGAEQRVTAPSTLPSGLHCVAVTIDADHDTINLYLDALLVASNANATLTPSELGNTVNNWLGRSQYAADAYFKGSYNKFRIYDYALGADEIDYITFPRQATYPSPDNGETGVDTSVVLSWKPGIDASSHDVYFGTDRGAVAEANDSLPACDTCVYRGRQEVADVNYAVPETLELDTTYYWRVDEVNVVGITQWPGEVWSFTTIGFQACNPNPVDLAANVPVTPLLSWAPGVAATSHDVYFGTGWDEVNSATGTSHPNVDYNTVDVNSYNPGILEYSRFYYWRVDEVNGANIWKGDVWTFRTRPLDEIILSNDAFEIKMDGATAGLMSLKNPNDANGSNFLLSKDAYPQYNRDDSYWLGDLVVRYRLDGASWQRATTGLSDDIRTFSVDNQSNPSQITVGYQKDAAGAQGVRNFDLIEIWALVGDELIWEIKLKNRSGQTMELGDLGLYLPFRSIYDGDTTEIQKNRFIRHDFVAGHGSFVYACKVGGTEPYLVITPVGDTKLEYYDQIGFMYDSIPIMYIHSGYIGPVTAGTWRQPHTSRILADGEEITYGFRFRWAKNFDGVRDALYQNNQFDVKVVPGMTVPIDLHARVALRTKNTINSVEAEFPADTQITYLGQPHTDTHLYKIQFSKLGENLITVNYGGGKYMILEFFVTESLEALIKKRSAHLINYQQVKDPSKWYDGLIGPWDMRNSVVRTPDNTDGFDLPWWQYVICTDDSALGHPAYIASKNVHFPDQSEIEAIEYYIENYVWGGLQRTDAETYPYGIYGVPNWYYNRQNDPLHIWRIYDYPHIFMMYYHMYEIAKLYPDMVSYLDKDGYLERAYRTAMAYFTIPQELPSTPQRSLQFKAGTMNEVVLVNIIEALREESRNADANALAHEWDKKVKYFIYDHPYPYVSEFAYDTTAYESSYAIAKWAMENPLVPDENLWYDPVTGRWFSHPEVSQDDVVEFMQRQLLANMASRGWLEATYYHMGSDFRGASYRLSYMSQMGGWAILDYGLNFAVDPNPYLQLGFASYLSSWALMNTGTAETNYGFWYPGLANDGASGWGFQSRKTGPTWLQNRTVNRGPWYYDGEIELGYCGALRAACSVVTQDPVFGLFGFGCDASMNGSDYNVVPRDGLREQLVMKNLGLSLKLNRDAFAKDNSIRVSDSSRWINFVLENETLSVHTTKLTISGLPGGSYRVEIDGVKQYTFQVAGSQETVLNLDIGSASAYDISIITNADLDGSGNVDFTDFAQFAQYWGKSNCGDCGGADITGNGSVDRDDLRRFAAVWLEGSGF